VRLSPEIYPTTSLLHHLLWCRTHNIWVYEPSPSDFSSHTSHSFEIHRRRTSDSDGLRQVTGVSLESWARGSLWSFVNHPRTPTSQRHNSLRAAPIEHIIHQLQKSKRRLIERSPLLGLPSNGNSNRVDHLPSATLFFHSTA